MNSYVARWRQRAGLTQRELAHRTRLSLGSVRDLEQGRVGRPRPDTLRQIGAALGVPHEEVDVLIESMAEGNGSTGGRGPRNRGADVLRLAVLGPLTATFGTQDIDLGPPKQRAILGLLALAPNQTTARSSIIDAIWDDRPPPSAVNLVQTYVGRLRRQLAPNGQRPDEAGILVSSGDGYRLVVPDNQLDLLGFRYLVAQARSARAEHDLSGACDHYAQALDLWRGQPLADIQTLRMHPALTALVGVRNTVVLEFADTAIARGDHGRVVPRLEEMTAAERLHGSAHARLMAALAGSGQQARALRVYDEIRHRLADELGVDPDRELVEVHRRIIRGDLDRPSPTPAPAVARRQLPTDIADFTGRQTELRALIDAAGSAHDESPFVVISAIEGMAGVGKTRLAVRLAHQLVETGRFADLQLYADLRGFSADQSPVDPGNVLAAFLHLLGVPSEHIPEDLDARAAAYRDRLHGKRALVLLDNAADEGQIVPLLPGHPGCLVIVTSRRSLALDGTQSLPLDVFAADEAVALLSRIAGQVRVSADPKAARQVVELCGRLPIAIALAAHRLRARPMWTVADLAARIEREDRRLGELVAGNRAVRATFALSYRALEPDTQRLFGLLALHPGQDFTPGAAAALAGIDPAQANTLVETLLDQHLVQQSTNSRYRFHDLMRAYAMERVQDSEGQGEAPEAVSRLLNWLLYATDAAERATTPSLRHVVLDPAAAPPHVPEFADPDDAVDWLEAEHGTIVSAVHLAAKSGHDAVAWRLALVITHFQDTRKFLADWVAVNQVALVSARREQDASAEATVLHSAGAVRAQLYQYPEAIERLREALAIRERIDDSSGQAATLSVLGSVYAMSGQPADAANCLRQAVEIRRRGDDRAGEGMALHNLGSSLLVQGENEEGILWLEQAVSAWQDAAHRFGEGLSLLNIGEAHLNLSRPERAIEALQRAQLLNEEIGSEQVDAMAHHHLGRAYLALARQADAVAALTRATTIFRTTGDRRELALALDALGLALAGDRPGNEPKEDALRCWQEAIAIFDELGDPQAAEVRHRLPVA